MNAVRDELDLRRELYRGPRDDARVEHLRIPPHSIDAEQAVLGGLLLSPESWPLVSDALTAEAFYRRDHQMIWRAIAELAEKSRPCDAVTLGEWFDSQGLSEQVAGGAYLVELASNTPSAANIRGWADIVADHAGKRALIDAGTTMVGDGFQPDGRDFAELLNSASQRLAELQPVQGGGMRKASETLKGWWQEFSERYSRGERVTGLPTPWKAFNDTTHGLQPSTLYLIAGRPSMGKSIVGLNLALFSAMREQTVGLFSLEMSASACHSRNIASLADVPHDFIAAPSERDDDGYLARMTPVIADLQKAPLFIDDTPALTVRQFEARARRMHARQPLDLLVVDHLHEFAFDPKREMRHEVGQVAHVARKLAREWRIPVVLLAQLNRRVATATDKRPTMADLRESGELEQKADVIALLHREDYYDAETHLQGVVELNFGKGRDLKTGRPIYLRNRFDVMRVDDWEGPIPTKPETEKRKSRGFTGNVRDVTGEREW